MKRILHTHSTIPRGFTLVEVMVTLLILSVGLLGLAALQASSLKFSLSAYQRTQATILAYDALDRMRANRVAAESNQYQTTMDRDASSYSGTNCYGSGANCSAAQLRNYDLFEWKTALETLLPGGQASIVTEPASGTGMLHHVTVRWIDDRSQDPPKFVDITVDGEL